MNAATFCACALLLLSAGCLGSAEPPAEEPLQHLYVSRVPPEHADRVAPTLNLTEEDFARLPAPFRTAVEQALERGHGSAALTSEEHAAVYDVLLEITLARGMEDADYYRLRNQVFHFSGLS